MLHYHGAAMVLAMHAGFAFLEVGTVRSKNQVNALVKIITDFSVSTLAFGEPFHDFAGSIVVHAMGGWLALGAVILLGSRRGRYGKDGRMASHPPSSISFLALGGMGGVSFLSQVAGPCSGHKKGRVLNPPFFVAARRTGVSQNRQAAVPPARCVLPACAHSPPDQDR